MFRTLVLKEVRSCWPWALAALVWNGWTMLCALVDFDSLLLQQLDPWVSGARLLDHVFILSWGSPLYGMVMLSAVALAIVLGIWQSLPESLLGTAPGLLHMVRSRSKLVTGKLVAGLALYSAGILLPVLLGTWAILATAPPFLDLGWSDTWFLWATAALGIPLYGGTLAAGLRQSRSFRYVLLQALVALAMIVVSATAMAMPSFALMVGMLGAGTIFGSALAYSGLSVREF